VIDGDLYIEQVSTGQHDTYRWRKTAGGELQMKLIKTEDPEGAKFRHAWVADPWERIGDPD
jgi:hypothetical protein